MIQLGIHVSSDSLCVESTFLFHYSLLIELVIPCANVLH